MRWLAALLLCCVGLSGSTSQIRGLAEPLPHDAYIWQRVWTPRLLAAVRSSTDIVRRWRILLAEADRSGGWKAFAVPWGEVNGPVVGVVRIDGRLDEGRIAPLLDRIAALAGQPALGGIEIDYDCPTSKLPAYAAFLAELRRRLPPSLALSITALPTWMSSPQLERLAADLDELVLQVHAVDDPRRGLFDPDQAERWVSAFARRIHKPFRVAVPAYDVRVTWAPDGRLASVEGEMPLRIAAADSATLDANPDQVAAFLQAMKSRAPDGLVGIVWFRLPTDADARAWSLATWRAVIADRYAPARVDATLVAADRPGLWTVTLSNDGAVDAALPRRVRLDPGCTMADGANGYRLRSEGAALVLETAGSGRLRPHATRIVGWARCPQPERQLHVAK